MDELRAKVAQIIEDSIGSAVTEDPAIIRDEAAADILALLQAGEPTDAVGAAEAEVGRYVYRRIAALMDAKAGTPEAAELDYLADIAANVEEYGEESCAGHSLGSFPDTTELVEALRAADEALRDYACQDGPHVPCLRNPILSRHGECIGASGDGLCGKPAADALTLVSQALSKFNGGGQ